MNTRARGYKTLFVLSPAEHIFTRDIGTYYQFQTALILLVFEQTRVYQPCLIAITIDLQKLEINGEIIPRQRHEKAKGFAIHIMK